MIQKVFNRYEKKYLLDQKTYEVFKKGTGCLYGRGFLRMAYHKKYIF